MKAFKTGLLVGILLAQFAVATYIGWTQTSRSLQSRVPKPDPKKYDSVLDAKHWKNPYLVVGPDGIEIVGITPVGRRITVDSVKGVLERLPDSAWPYGLVVVVQDAGVLSGKADSARVGANRIKLLNLLKELGIAVERWPA
jgi:hypothetical protein